MSFTITVSHIVSHVADLSIVIARVAFPASTVDVTHRATFDIGICGSDEACRIVFTWCTDTKDVANISSSTRRINVFLDCTAKHGNVCRAVNTTCQRIRCRTISATVDITSYGSPLIDNDIGVVSLIESCLLFSSKMTQIAVVDLSLLDKRILEVGVLIWLFFIIGISFKLSNRCIIIAYGPCILPNFQPFILIRILQRTANNATFPFI